MRTVLITGAGRGIGLAIARACDRAGYGLVLVVKSDSSAAALRAMRFRNAQPTIHSLDLADMESRGSFAESWRGELWAVVNNAGVCLTEPLSEVAGGDVWETTMQTNLTAPFDLTAGLLPRLSRPGRILNISSQLGLEGRAGYSAYCASKFGLIGLTKCWAKELGPDITVNAICPGWVDTDMTREDVARQAERLGIPVDEYRAEVCRPLELKRFTTPEEVADLAVYLLSDRAAGITGREWLMQTIWNNL